MLSKYLTYINIYFYLFKQIHGQETHDSKSILGIIVNAIKKEIEKLMHVADTIIEDAVQELINLKDEILKLAQAAIKTATDAIMSVIDDAFDTIRGIAEDAIDSGINITECYVNNVDKLNIIRRKLLIEETECATNQLSDFNKIIEVAVKNFTRDLEIIGKLPGRLQNCLTSLNAISCVTELVTDVTKLQIEIPQQVLEIMMEISNYMIYFDQNLHKCQFDELREANIESRKVIDEVKFCVKEANITTTDSYSTFL